MKNFFWLLLLLSFILVACDMGGPRRRTALYKTDYGKSYTQYPVDPIIGGGTTTGTTVPAEFSHCNFTTYNLNDANLGRYNLCRSQTNTNRILLQLEYGVTDGNLCVFPTSTSGGKSIYVGEAQCFSASNGGEFHQIDLEKNRPGFSNATINGVMIMPDVQYTYFWGSELAPDAYLDCMNMLYLSDQCTSVNPMDANSCMAYMYEYNFVKFGATFPYADLAQAVCSSFKGVSEYVYRDI